MQYLLSKEEYDELVHAKELAEEKVRGELEAKVKAQRKVAADEMGALLGRWSQGRPAGYEWVDPVPRRFFDELKAVFNKFYELPTV